jgi:AcrR family transcriptional regulator
MSGGRPHAVSRDSIAEAARELFLEQGYERTTVAHIARRVGVSRSSFFNYFESKSEVFWSGLDERIEFLDGFLAAACPSSRPAEVVADAVREAFSRFTPDALALALVNSDAMGVVPELTQEMATRQWRIAASISPYLRRTGEEALAAEVHAAAYAGAVVAALRAWALAGAGRESLDDLLRRALGVLR